MIETELLPTEDQIYAWIEEVFAQGVRRPGYPADRWAEQHCFDQFQTFGLHNVRREPVRLPYWEPKRWSLTVTHDGEALDVPGFPLPHAAPAAGLEAPLVAYDADDPGAVKDAFALVDLPLQRPPHAALAGLATWTYDPDGAFAASRHILPFSRLIQGVMEPAIEAGAVGFIGVLSDYPGDSHEYYVPYDAVERAIPGLWVSGSAGARLLDIARRGDARARIQVDSTREQIETSNVVGELPGADDELVVIGSHHDGPWSSAVEDGSGIALIFAQAAYWSRVPAARRPHRLIFLLNSGHMAGGAGAKAFVEQHAMALQEIVLEVHLEHAANEFSDASGAPAPTGHPEARWWFTSRAPQLESTVRQAIEQERLDRSLIMPPTAFGPAPTTDGAAFHLAGVPLVNFLTAPWYLFDPQDTLDKVHRPSLVPVTRAAIRIIESTAGVSAAEMRAAVVDPGRA